MIDSPLHGRLGHGGFFLPHQSWCTLPRLGCWSVVGWEGGERGVFVRARERRKKKARREREEAKTNGLGVNRKHCASTPIPV